MCRSINIHSTNLTGENTVYARACNFSVRLIKTTSKTHVQFNERTQRQIYNTQSKAKLTVSNVRKRKIRTKDLEPIPRC